MSKTICCLLRGTERLPKETSIETGVPDMGTFYMKFKLQKQIYTKLCEQRMTPQSPGTVPKSHNETNKLLLTHVAQ